MALQVPLGQLEEVIAPLWHHGVLLRTTAPEGIVLGRPPEHLTGVAVLDMLDTSEVDTLRQRVSDPAWDFLQYRQHLVQDALAGVTLQALATSQGMIEAP
jgi:hypothetical protein